MAGRIAEEADDDDLRQVSGAKHSQSRLILGLFFPDSQRSPQSPQLARHRARVVEQGLESGLEEMGVLLLGQQTVLELERTTRFPQSPPTPSNAPSYSGLLRILEGSKAACRNAAPHVNS